MRRICLILPALACLALASAGFTAPEEKTKPAEAGYVSIFDGKTLDGWHVSAKTGHSSASKHKTGGRWLAEDGMIVGSQDIPGNGGIVITDKQDYENFEIILEMKNDFGPDSGLFLRSNDKGQAFQAMIDYHSGGNLMGLYGEGLNPGFSVRNFTFTDPVDPGKIKEDNAPVKLPVTTEEWPKFWKHGEWNELKARIVGNPAKMTTWIKGVKFMEYTDKVERPDHAKGGIALQVHGGTYGGPGDLTKLQVRYRNVRVKVLDKE
jgi:3-keto-disaccharide hydrolase